MINTVLFYIIALILSITCAYGNEAKRGYSRGFALDDSRHRSVNEGGYKGNFARAYNKRSGGSVSAASIKRKELISLQAAYRDKNALAIQAKQSAIKAKDAVSRKQSVVTTLEQLAQEAEEHISTHRANLEQSQRSAWTTQIAASNANQQVTALTAALKSAQNNARLAEKAANEAEREVGAQERMVAMAKLRAQQVSNQLEAALDDLRDTQTRADRAAKLAVDTIANVAQISAHISANSVSSKS